MEKVLIAVGKDEEDSLFKELLLFLQKKKYTILTSVNEFTNNKRLEYENFMIDPQYREVNINGESISLTNYEFEILYLLAKNPGQVFSKEQIYNQVWDTPYCGAVDNVMSLIRRIRKKIEPNPSKPIYVLTVWGIGYKLNDALKIK